MALVDLLWIGLVTLLASILFMYMKIVPPNNIELGSLGDVLLDSPYKEDFWSESGYVDLPFGKTHYYFIGPKDGIRIVFVHGISTPAPCFPTYMELLASKGFRILTYEHYGRGYSASPGAIYSEQFYVAQLALLLHKLGWTNADFIGYSLGGGILACFAALYPEMVNKALFIAPTGLMEKINPMAHITKIPILGPVLVHTIGRRMLIRITESNHKLKPSECKELAHLIKLNGFMIKHHPGFIRSYFSTVLNFKFGNHDKAFAKIEKTHHNKTMVIWGSKDHVVPFYLSERLKKLMPSTKLVVKDEWGHSIVAELPEYCAEHTIAFFSSE